MEKTIRGNGKWAKISGKRGAWTCAKGWAGSIKAIYAPVYPTKDGAIVAGQYWLKD